MVAAEDAEVLVAAAEEALDRALDLPAVAVRDQVLVPPVGELGRVRDRPVVAVRVHRRGQRLGVRRRSVIRVAGTMRKLRLKVLAPTMEWDNVRPRRLENFLVLARHRATLLRKGSRISRRVGTTLS